MERQSRQRRVCPLGQLVRNQTLQRRIRNQVLGTARNNTCPMPTPLAHRKHPLRRHLRTLLLRRTRARTMRQHQHEPRRLVHPPKHPAPTTNAPRRRTIQYSTVQKLHRVEARTRPSVESNMETNKPCFICKQPLHTVKIGPHRLPYRVHRGKELDCCTAVHPYPASIALLRRAMEHMCRNKENFKLHNLENGQPMVHGEKLR
jgi:hypothetical protein